MKLLRKFFPEIASGIGIVLSYFLLRLLHIMNLPLFTDEAIYVRWSQIAKQDAAWRFISLTDGKQPMFVWWAMILMKFFHDPLLASRMVSVVAGFLTVVGLFFLGREIFKNKWVGFLTAGLYVLYPFGLVYDRMALYDSLVALFAVWSLYFEILLVRQPKAWIAFTLALVMGGGMLTKTSDFFSMYLMPATLLLFDFKSKHVVKRFATWLWFALLAVGLANGYYLVLRLSPFFHIISDKNGIFVYPLHDWIKHPLTFAVGNLQGLWDWFSGYMTYPVIVAIAGSFFVARKFWKEKVLLIIFWIVPFVGLGVFGRILYPRFILFMTVPLLCMAALSLYALISLKNKIVGLVVLVLVVLLWVRADYYVVNDFAHAPIPQADLTQYSNDWPAGGGINQIIAYLSEKAATQKIHVATEGTFGSLPTYAVEIYLGENRNIEKGGIWPINSDIPKDLLEKADTMPVYMIFNETQMPPSGWPLSLVLKYQKGIGNKYISLYKVEPQKP